MSLDDVIFLSNVRLSFPHLAAPQAKKPGDPNDGPPKYSAVALLTPDHPGWTQFHQVVQRIALEKWKDKTPHAMQHINADPKKRCYGAGQEKVNSKTFQIFPGYEGMYFISAGNKNMPQMIDATGAGIDPTNTGACQALARAMYPGCYVNMAIKPWLQENDHGIAIRCELVSVQFHADGKPFGDAVKDASALFQGAPAAPGAAPNPFGAAPAAAMPSAPFPGQQAAPVANPFAPAPAAAPNPFGAAPAAAPPWAR